MGLEKIKEHIQGLFNLSEEEVLIFLSEFTKREYLKNDFFIESGETCHKIGLIEKGLMICVYNKNGNEVLDEFAFENNFITNYHSFLTRSPSEKEIKCFEDTTVHVITRQSLEKLGSNHSFMERMAKTINEKLFLRTHDRVKSLLVETASERYSKLISQRPDLVQRVPQYLIASYLNVKPETISRIRKKLTNDTY